MDFTVEKQIIQTQEEIKTEMREHPIDCEAVIPDYCPDMDRILKCRATPVVAGVRFTDEMAMIEGSVQITLLYADREGEVSSFSQVVPLYHELSGVENEDACVTAKMQYCNCRAVNARKLEFHGAVSLKVVFTKVQSHTLITGAQGSGIQLLTENTQLVTLSARAEKRMMLSDEILVESGSVRCILQQHGVVHNITTQSVGGKCVVKGELAITASYQNAKRKYEMVRTDIPFSQIIEVEGLAEDDLCCVTAALLSLELRPRTGLDGECKNLSVGAEIKLILNGYRILQVPLVMDGYSTCCGVGIRRCSEGLIGCADALSETATVKERFMMDRELTSVVDCWCEIEVERVTYDQQQMNLSGNLLCGILGFDHDRAPVYIEKTLPFHWVTALGGESQEWIYQPDLTVEKCSFVLLGEREIELRTQVGIGGQLYGKRSLCGISDLVLDTNVTPDSVNVPIVLYYAKAGERVFDIAKRYHTPCDAVCSANGLTDEFLTESKGLIIPIS